MVGDLLLPRLTWLPVVVLLLVNPSFLVQSAFQLQNILGEGTSA